MNPERNQDIGQNPDAQGKNLCLKAPLLFLIIILYNFFFFFIPLLFQHRIPQAHDGLFAFILKYYILNNAVMTGEIPQWLPYLTHGSTASVSFFGQATFLQNALSLVGPLLHHLNFIPIFLIGIFLDDLVLIIGCWLLGRKLFESPLTAFFVSLTVLGTAIWPFQPWFNFYFFYAVPLILYLGHEFLETGKWRYFLLAGNLLAIQTCGEMIYFLPMTSLIICLYFLCYIALNPQTQLKQIRNLQFKKTFFVSLFLTIGSFILVYLLFIAGTDQVVHYSIFRSPDRTVDLKTFLTYGQTPAVFLHYSWKDLFLGLPINLDYTLHIGMFPLPLIFIGLFLNFKRKHLHLWMTTTIIFLICSGTFMANFFYYLWPMMKTYRHLTYSAVFFKLFLCFLAGIGMDAILKSNFASTKKSKTILLFIGGTLLCIGLLVFYGSYDPENIRACSSSFRKAATILNLLKFDENYIALKLLNSFYFFTLAVIALMIFPLLKSSKIKNYFIVGLLSFHVFYLYDYKWHEIERQTFPADKELQNLTRFQPIPFSQRRGTEKEMNPREKIFYTRPLSATYGYTNIFLFKDQVSHQHRVDYCLKPLHNLMKAFWGQSLDDEDTLPEGLVLGEKLHFPLKHPAAGKITGIAEDKIQFFQNAYFIPKEETLADLIAQPRYAGDLLFVSDKTSEADGPSAMGWTSQKELSANERLKLPYKILKFDSNNLILKTFNPQPSPIWLFYSDVWHPFWKAWVNGKTVPVYKADLAYKAIPLPPGENKIHFRFENKLSTILLKILEINSLFWIIFILTITSRILFELKNKR